MIENTHQQNSDGKKSNSEKMLRSSVTPKSSTATVVSLTKGETANSPTIISWTMKPGSEKSDNEKSVSKKLFSNMAGRKTLLNENLTTKIPAVNISTKKYQQQNL